MTTTTNTELHARLHLWEEFAEHNGLRLAPDTAAEDVTALRQRISELERQLHDATRFLANESLVRENETLRQRIQELGGIVQIISARETRQQKASSGDD